MGIFRRAARAADPESPDMTVVYFAADTSKLAKMDVGLGPCVIVDGHKKSITSPLAQDRGETPEQTKALFTVLTGRPPAEALEVVSTRGHGTLFRCTPAFVDALADASQVLLDLRGDDAFMAERERISVAWMEAVEWPSHYVSLVNRLDRLPEARVAREKGLPFYCWSGPSVPMRSLVSGSGPHPGKA